MVILENVNKSFHLGTPVHALQNVSFNMAPGEWVTLIGPSGSGKSTLLSCMAALEHPDSGHVEIAGENIEKLQKHEIQKFRRATIGMVFQDFRLLPQINVLDNVTLPLLPYENKSTVTKRAVQLLENLGIEKRKKHLPGELSGGEKQRTAIARALINKPKLLLMDEPTGNVDQKNRDHILAIVKALKEEGHTILFATHDGEITKHSDKTFSLQDGVLHEEG